MSDEVMPVQAVVLPTWEAYLEALKKRSRDLTTMIWGWQTKGAKRMATPRRLLARGQQDVVAFLYRPNEAGPTVTHAALSGLILHREEAPPGSARDGWLFKRRIERFGLKGEARDRWMRGEEIAQRETPHLPRSFYVVTATTPLPGAPLPYASLNLVRGGSLSPRKERGYALVWLPRALERWYADARQGWDGLKVELSQAE